MISIPSAHLTQIIAHLRADQADLLLLQALGASNVEVTDPGEPSEETAPARKPFTVRLLQGEALYLPHRSAAVLRHEPGTRHILLQIAAQPTAADTP
ncbi:hypothetical protein [Streptacidiphilus sp. MAP12-20]|uniref:hypothetical protein n=1 Tax=Streptacidiphilus sp. MAP12-20 TaxID=3156299 RepID=UPI003516131C